MANDRVFIKCKGCKGWKMLLSHFGAGSYTKDNGILEWLDAHAECHPRCYEVDLGGDPGFELHTEYAIARRVLLWQFQNYIPKQENKVEENPNPTPTVGAHLPRYKCHKIVNAAKISDLTWNRDGSVDVFFVPLNLEVSGETFSPINVEAPASRRFEDVKAMEDKGYLVVYRDGYISWSPTAELEDGYSLDDPTALELGAMARDAGRADC